MFLSFLHLNSDFRNSSLSFGRLRWDRIMNKPVINWQNFAQVQLQLKVAFRKGP